MNSFYETESFGLVCFWRQNKVNDLNRNISRRRYQRSFIETWSRGSASTSLTHNFMKDKRLYAPQDRSKISFDLFLTLAHCPEPWMSAVPPGGIEFLHSGFQTTQKKKNKKEKKWAPPEITICHFADFITKHMPNVAGIPAGSARAVLTLAFCVSSSSSSFSWDFKVAFHSLRTSFLSMRRNSQLQKVF